MTGVWSLGRLWWLVDRFAAGFGVGDAVGLFVERVTGVALDPAPLHVPLGDLEVQSGPQVLVLVALPALRHGIDEVCTVAVDAHVDAGGSGLNALNGGENLHPVVRGVLIAAMHLPGPTVLDDDRGPTAGTGVPDAAAVGEYVDHVLVSSRGRYLVSLEFLA